jgi:hypothetical protein
MEKHIHKCSCGETLGKTSGEGDGWSKLYECIKCGKLWKIEAKIEFKKLELVIKEAGN